jgi:putative membrane protein
VARFRPDWLDEGEDPDYRFSLANERTFLAWIRTALALIAAAVAIVQLVPSFKLDGARVTLGVVLAITGLVSTALAYVRWSNNERAMRMSVSLPFSRCLFVLTAVLSLVGLAVVLLVAFASR